MGSPLSIPPMGKLILSAYPVRDKNKSCLLFLSVVYFEKICPVYLTCHANCNQTRIKSFAPTRLLIFHETRKA